MKLFKALLIFWLSATAAAASAQRAEDSLAITDGPWKVLIDENGILCKKLQTRVFDTLQRISVVEVDPSLYYPLLVQDTLIEKTSQMGVKNNGVAAINGGYFKTKTTRAEAADLIKINGKYPRQSHTAGSTGALGIDSLGLLHFAYVPSIDPEWFDRFPSVLVAGPMRVADSGSGEDSIRMKKCLFILISGVRRTSARPRTGRQSGRRRIVDAMD